MHISEFDFDLPPELIAQHPAPERDLSRMLVVDRSAGRFHDSQFISFPDYLKEGDCLVLNDTRVFPARLIGKRSGFSARVELFLVDQLGNNRWEALVKPGRALRIGSVATFGKNELSAEIIEILPSGRRLIELKSATDETVEELIERIGATPLPPYIKRDDPSSVRFDSESYQTIYARERGAIAAPTAGLHFTRRVIDTVRERGVTITTITHHVGYGTFQPVRVEQIEEHRIERERFVISDESASAINQARARGGRVVAVGTTTTRALETAAGDTGEIDSGSRATELFIYPGYRFKAIDALLTNFHLPKSSLLMLVSAFSGRDLLLDAYRHAVAERYRFYSYGDCMFLY
jgi:S-adenosylmethionine:tRNA ribosyltransferase-isomerase